MKRISEEKQRSPQVLDEGVFKKRKVEVGEADSFILNCALLDVFPNICTRGIEIGGNYRIGAGL